MSIKDFSEKIKHFSPLKALWWNALSDDLFLGLVVVLVGIGAFGLGRISKIEGSKAPIRIENEPMAPADTFAPSAPKDTTQEASVVGAVGQQDTFVASKSGTKYYFPWCSGAQRIAPANLIHFATQEAAKAAGYSPSSTCKGL